MVPSNRIYKFNFNTPHNGMEGISMEGKKEQDGGTTLSQDSRGKVPPDTVETNPHRDSSSCIALP